MKHLHRSSHNILNRFTAKRLPGDTLAARIGRAVCEAECLPRKEFFEAWETARRTRRVLRGGPVVELAAGHGLLAAILLILDDTSPDATCVDIRKPKSHDRLMGALTQRWPRLGERIRYVEAPLETADAPAEALVISVHACGTLTDRVIDVALEARSRLAVLPCCHDLQRCDTGRLTGWMDGPLAVDATRAARLTAAGYHVMTATIPKDITPKNRLLMAWP
jgi:hypothetical protein